jgi:hypothetical protein
VNLLGVFIAWPWLALLPAVLLGLLYARRRNRAAAFAAAGWALYAVYEFGMQRRWLCTGECNIRVDLLLLYPLLLVLSLAAVVSALRPVRAGRETAGR